MTCGAQVRQGNVYGRAVWTLDSPKLRISITQSGGHVAELVLKEGETINPLWVQKKQTFDAEQYEKGKHERMFGGGSGARLLAGLLGHNVCFPYWGNPSRAEGRAGMTFHGETGINRWKQTAATADSLSLSVDLPESMTQFQRMVRIAGQVAYFEEIGVNQSAWDRPLGWCEHVTIGPPFLEKGITVFDSSLTRGRNTEQAGEVAWPNALVRGGEKIDLRTVRNVQRSDFVQNFLVDPSREYAFFTATHPGKGLVVGYVFRREQFRWMNIWEANNPDMLTRGMEFSNTPIHGTARALYEAKPLFDTPLFEWLEGKAKMTKRFAAFVTRVPAGFKGVADVRVRGDKLVIMERGSDRTVTLAWQPKALSTP